MLRRFLESSVLFIHIIRWFIIATGVGVAVGITVALFLILLDKTIDTTARYSWYWLMLPVAFMLSSELVRRLAPDAKGHGTEKVIEAIHRRSGKIPFAVVPVKAVATLVTLAAGGAAGKEGPAAQLGAGIASKMADLLRMKDSDRKKIVMCGVSAGFAVVFGTPIAGAIFGVEVLFVGAIVYDVLFPSFVAGIIAFATAQWVGLNYPHDLDYISIGVEPLLVVQVLAAGIMFGLLALMLIEMMRMAHKLNARLPFPSWVTAGLGGTALVLLVLVFGDSYLGLGIRQTNAILEGGGSSLGAPFIKMLFTSITLNFGGSGGTLSPIFFIGAASGDAFASLFNLDQTLFAAIGFVALLAGATNTPISASIMAVELFGPDIAAYAALGSIASYLMSGHRSIYPSQVLAYLKSPALRIETGKELQHIEGVLRFNAKEADPMANLMVKGGATTIRRIRATIRRRKNLPPVIKNQPGQDTQNRPE